MSIMSQAAVDAQDSSDDAAQAEAIERLRRLGEQRVRLRTAEFEAIVEARLAGATLDVIASSLQRSVTLVRDDLVRSGVGTAAIKSPRGVSASAVGE